jgi:hypothetical protein
MLPTEYLNFFSIAFCHLTSILRSTIRSIFIILRRAKATPNCLTTITRRVSQSTNAHTCIPFFLRLFSNAVRGLVSSGIDAHGGGDGRSSAAAASQLPTALQHQHNVHSLHHMGSQSMLATAADAPNEFGADDEKENDDEAGERRRDGGGGGGAVPNSENRARLLLAEHRLRQAVREDPLAHDAWLLLGRVLLASGDAHRASECLFNQLELERSAPVRPFACIHYQI